MMKPELRKPHNNPQTSTDTSDNPYASISAMNTPPRKLLIAANTISASSPGTPRTTPNVPRRSTLCSSPSPLAAVSPGTRTVSRCTAASSHRNDCQDQRVPHAREADQEAADHRRDQERDTRGRADETVGLVASVLLDEQRDGRRHRDATNVADDHSGQQQEDEHPEGWAGRIGERVVAGSEVDRQPDRVHRERAER